MKKVVQSNCFPVGAAAKKMATTYNLTVAEVYTTIKKALESAYQREVNPANELIIEINEKQGLFLLWEAKKVVTTVTDPQLEISLTHAQAIDSTAKVGITLRCPFSLETYRRFAINHVKQALKHFINVSESQKIYQKYHTMVGKLLTGTVENIEYRYYSVYLGDTFAFIPKSEQIPHERMRHGQRIKMYVQTVHENHPFGQIECSRKDPALVRRLFELEIPEVADQRIEIKQIVREAGIRSKIAIISHDPTIEPIGTCIGQGGMRIKTISNELNGEKIDIFLWHADWKQLMINAFTPAKVIHYQVDEAEQKVLVVVHDEQYPNAIGKIGAAVRLVSQLVGYQVDVQKLESFAADQTEILLNGNLKLFELEKIELSPAILAKCVSPAPAKSDAK